MFKNMLLSIPCHRKPERSFLELHKHIPLCARCTGMLLGLLTLPLYFLIALPTTLSVSIALTAQFPLLIDGFTQKWKWRISTNWLRVTTGLLSGNGMALLVSSSIKWITS
ncbi:DUF2085 domain-containing protein [Bacillus bombysepticus]|uniref:DUF2085 domain-containing protein n=1 Tax=Bacillus bombysepticus TaxID=658666 RepID=UPI003017F5BE